MPLVARIFIYYLTEVLDVFSCRTVRCVMETYGWTERALWQRRLSLVIHHSDQRCHHSFITLGKRCKEVSVWPSTGSLGDCFDNTLPRWKANFLTDVNSRLMPRHE